MEYYSNYLSELYTISFIDGEKIDLTQGIIRFKEGVPRFTDFNMKVWVDLVNLTNELITQTVATCIGDIDVVSRNGTTELLRMQTNIGDLWLTFQFENDTEGRFHLWHNFLNATYHIHSDIYKPYVYPNCYIGIKYDGTLCDLYIEAGGDE